MSTALKRQVYGRGRGDPVLVKRAADDLRAANFRDLALLRSADMGSLAFVFGYCGQGYSCLRYKSTAVSILRSINPTLSHRESIGIFLQGEKDRTCFEDRQDPFPVFQRYCYNDILLNYNEETFF